MREGWVSDSDYLVLFDETEAAQANDGYDIAQYLPGFTVIGIIGWDDFLVRNKEGHLFRVPTVPLVHKYLVKIERMPDAGTLKSDARFAGKIKWYKHPIVLGGDPKSEENLAWVSIPEHQQLVKWWNQKYREIAAAEQGRANT